jgi:hypothetical protein
MPNIVCVQFTRNVHGYSRERYKNNYSTIRIYAGPALQVYSYK